MAGKPLQVEIEEGVAFGTGGDRELLCDVYRPQGLTKPAIGVLMLFGQGWVAGERSQLRGYGILLGRLGLVCVCSDYRLTGEAKWPAQIHDVKAAIRWFRANAGSLGVDPDRIVLWGNSAGGQLGLLAAATAGVADLEGDGGTPGVSTAVAAVAAIYPVTEFVPSMGDGWQYAQSLVEEGTDAEAELAKAGVLAHVRQGLPPTALVHGAADTLVSADQSTRLFEALEAAGVPVDLHLYAGQNHAFDMQRDFAREVSGLIEGFYRRHLPTSE